MNWETRALWWASAAMWSLVLIGIVAMTLGEDDAINMVLGAGFLALAATLAAIVCTAGDRRRW